MRSVEETDPENMNLGSTIETTKVLKEGLDSMEGPRLKAAETTDKESQTDVDYPTVTEVLKEIEVVREVPVREDPDKIDNTDIGIDEKGHFRIFEQLDDPDKPDASDKLTVDFLQRTKVSQIQILLAEVKKHITETDEAFIKIEYVKKLYAEQLKKLVAAQRTLKQREIELEIKQTEVDIKDEQIKKQSDGNVENMTAFKTQEANQSTLIVKLQSQVLELNE